MDKKEVSEWLERLLHNSGEVEDLEIIEDGELGVTIISCGTQFLISIEVISFLGEDMRIGRIEK